MLLTLGKGKKVGESLFLPLSPTLYYEAAYD
jgi:hypothetical protein